MERAQRANSETGTGFACGAKLSEILPAARVARFVRMTQGIAALIQ
jgi:hypothetical protein